MPFFKRVNYPILNQQYVIPYILPYGFSKLTDGAITRRHGSSRRYRSLPHSPHFFSAPPPASHSRLLTASTNPMMLLSILFKAICLELLLSFARAQHSTAVKLPEYRRLPLLRSRRRSRMRGEMSDLPTFPTYSKNTE
jgi:hypothetical protein